MIEQEAVPEQTSWKMLFVMALASVVLAAGSVWFLTQDFDTSTTAVETANEPEPDPTPVPTSTPEPDDQDDEDEDEDDADNSAGTDDSEESDERITLPQKDEDDEDCTAQQVDDLCVDLGNMFEGIELPTAVATAIPVLPQLVPRPLITTVPTRPTRVPAPSPAPAPAPAPIQAAPAPAPPPVVYIQPAPAPPPPPVYQPAPAPVYVPAPAPAPQPAAVNPGACTQIVVSVDMNGDGVADGSLPSPCSPCPSGALPAQLNGDAMLDC